MLENYCFLLKLSCRQRPNCNCCKPHQFFLFSSNFLGEFLFQNPLARDLETLLVLGFGTRKKGHNQLAKQKHKW